MGRRGRHPDPNTKRTQAANAQSARVGAMTATPTPASASSAPRKVSPPASVAGRPAAARFWKAHAADLEADGRLTADRAETFGLLAHLGLTRRQVLTVVSAEGAVWTAAGALLGLGLGIAVSVVLVKVVNPQSFHWTMELLLPWPRLAALCAAVIAAGTLTAGLAARRAASRSMALSVKEDW